MSGDCGPGGGRQQPPAPRCPTQHPGQEWPRTPAQCCPGGRIQPGHSGLLLCPRPGGMPPCSCSLCPGHCCQIAWPLRGPAHGRGGLPCPAHWLPCCIAGCCVPTPGERVGTGPPGWPLPVPWPLPPCSRFAQCKRRTPGLGAPPPLPQSLWLYFPFLTQLDPISFPSPWGLGGSCLGSAAGYTPPHSRGARCWLVWAAPLWRALASLAQLSKDSGGCPWSVSGLLPAGRGLGKGSSWEGWGQGAAQGIFL